MGRGSRAPRLWLWYVLGREREGSTVAEVIIGEGGGVRSVPRMGYQLNDRPS